MADNINFNLNNSLDRLSNGFSLPSVVVMPQIKTKSGEKKNDVFVPTKEPEPTTKKPEVNKPEITKPDITKPENNNIPTGADPKQKKPLGKIVFYSMLVVAGFVLLLTKGMSGATAGKVKAMVDKWENKLLRNASKNRVVGAIDTTIARTAQKVKRIFSLTEAIPNFTTAGKDTLVHKITSWDFLNIKNKYVNLQPVHKFLNKWLPLQKIADFITRNVLKITYSAVDSKYKIVSAGMDNLEARYNKIFSKYVKQHPEKAKEISELWQRARQAFHNGFSKSQRDLRLEKIHQELGTLADDVSAQLGAPFRNGEVKGFFNKIKAFFKKFRKNYSTYVTPQMADPIQSKHKKTIDTAKRVLSNEIIDVSSKLQGSANEMKHLFMDTDIESRLSFGDLIEKLNTYKWLSGSKEAASRQKLQQEILSNLSQIKEKILNYTYTDKKGNIVKYTSEEIAKITDKISNMEEILANSSEKGILQELLTVVKPIFSKKDYKSVKAGTNYLNNLLNEATDIEGNNMFNKVAESKVGSIVTDMMGLGLLGYTGVKVTSKGNNKEEKISAALKVGIPLLGTIGTYFYSAAKAFSGITNVIFSLGTGFILNRIGDSINNYYQKRYVENKTVKEIVQDTYEDVTKT